MGSYNPDNYATVAERLALASAQMQTVITEPPVMLTDSMGYIRATVALQDGRTATGIASFQLGLTGRSAQATNPIEDGETSAVGRALAFLGYASSKSIASREEVREAQRRAETNGGASYAADAVVPTCPEHHKPMKPGKDGASFYCPIKHGEKWYSVKAQAAEPPGVVGETDLPL